MKMKRKIFIRRIKAGIGKLNDERLKRVERCI